MSHITWMARRRSPEPMQFFGQEFNVAEKLAHSALECKRVDDENNVLRAQIAQHEAVEKLRLAQLERADMIQTTQRLRIDELSKLNTEYCGDIERLEEVVAKLRTELAAVLGPGGMEILRGECGDEN